jgi:hypothetical protein
MIYGVQIWAARTGDRTFSDAVGIFQISDPDWGFSPIGVEKTLFRLFFDPHDPMF